MDCGSVLRQVAACLFFFLSLSLFLSLLILLRVVIELPTYSSGNFYQKCNPCDFFCTWFTLDFDFKSGTLLYLVL